MNKRVELLTVVTKAIVKRDGPDKFNKVNYYNWIYSLLSNKTDNELLQLKKKLKGYLDES